MAENEIKKQFQKSVNDSLSDFAKCEKHEYSTEPCPDQYVGKVESFMGKEEFCTREKACNIEKHDSQRYFILVLESPHKNEFTPPAGPAKGTTGRLIREHAQKVFSQITEFDEIQLKSYGVILVNAIQYQCSLGLPPSRFRDKIFLSVWKSGGRKNFIQRLSALYREGDIVINACTKGKTTQSLHEYVSNAINEVLQGTKFYNVKHPSSWFNLK